MKWSFKGFKALGQFIFNIDSIVPFTPISCLFFRVELLDIRGFLNIDILVTFHKPPFQTINNCKANINLSNYKHVIKPFKLRFRVLIVILLLY